MVRAARSRWPEAVVAETDLRTADTALDIRDRDACFRLFQRWRPTHLIHGAAITSGVDQQGMAAVNVIGTGNILDAALEAGTLERGVLLSSSGVYGAPRDDLACDEDHALDLRGEYAATKRAAELHLQEHALSANASLIIARLGPCYGAGEQAGEFRSGVSLIGQLATALHQQQRLRIQGSDYARDWTHVDDVCAAVYGLLRTPVLRHRCYNVSSGVPVTARQVIALFVQRGLQVEWVSDRASADLVLRPEDGRKPMVIERLRADTGFTSVVELSQSIDR